MTCIFVKFGTLKTLTIAKASKTTIFWGPNPQGSRKWVFLFWVLYILMHKPTLHSISLPLHWAKQFRSTIVSPSQKNFFPLTYKRAFTVVHVVKAHLLLILITVNFRVSRVRDFGPAGPSIFLLQNYLKVVYWRGSFDSSLRGWQA